MMKINGICKTCRLLGDKCPWGLEFACTQYVTDIVLNDFGCETEFKVTNPLEYMSRSGLSSKNNFFEKREGEYTRVDIPTSIDGIFEEEF